MISKQLLQLSRLGKSLRVNSKSYSQLLNNTQSQQISYLVQRQFNQQFSRQLTSFTQIPSYSFALEPQEKVIKNPEILKVLNQSDNTKFRNVAIIAHVDHGKTTLVDTLLKTSGLEHDKSMDSNQLEQEKGITILSKVTGVTFKDYKINIVDTPGHHDFGGEVERIMSMVDGVILLVCATEGPMTQTKFVLKKALKQGLKPIVIINKVDRPTARVKEVESEILDMFIEMEVNEDLLDYPVYYASGREGWAVPSIEEINSPNKNGVACVMDAIVSHVPYPKQQVEGDFQMLISQTESNQYHGKMVIGKILRGQLNVGDKLTSVDSSGNLCENGKVMKIVRRYGMKQMEINTAYAGDIVSVAGFSNSTVAYTLNKYGCLDAVPSIPIDPPIMSVSIATNTSPLAGKDGGQKLTYSQIRQRLQEESENDVALKVQGLDRKDGNSLIVEGRGDLHLGILFENMRREGFEMSLTPPQILFKEINGKQHEPIEKVTIELDPVYSANVIEKLSQRKGVYENCEELSPILHKLSFTVPTRGMIGFRSELLNDTKGTAVLESCFLEYQEHRGALKKNNKGPLICTSEGIVTAYALKTCEKFGQLFIEPGSKVYPGQVIGENQKESEVELNPTKKKELNNIRTKSHEEKIVLQPHRVFSIEEAICYIRDDEIVEVTPKEIRIRKKELDSNVRAKIKRDSKK
ncbi:elongation factor Tu GTP-binding domain protein (macronuclear) [Tetrahymena thermophila SB210]|uniref:Elongation factor Tu GTP-binding domain protein n=1 Tax=Tetrahymena thermophila (strain SB210) TaxID=312017 RepID=Q22A26_TETTS|nr:elongation factor Tu GTP-binding domain protein [Tetrahymena thermophila SB210]EAR82153.2 elongation factor Tu GTP-binding domain protein [Tetrahymena thermophila SB210]|eukprot:XP_001029817.2 elongation factor Tu GTP-binding domain protein [Tetrahymena thermophila SB210]